LPSATDANSAVSGWDQRVTEKGIPDINSAAWLIQKLLIPDASLPNNITSDKNFYCLIHVVYFSTDSSAASHPPTSTFYLYHAGDPWAATGLSQSRIFGSSSFYLMTIAVNYPPTSDDAATSFQTNMKYEFAVTHRVAANIQNILNVFSGYDSSHTRGATHAVASVWGWSRLDRVYVPSDITVTSEFSTDDGKSFSALDKAPFQIDDEGLYLWDVSLGVPITSYKQVQFQNNLASPTTIDQRNLMVLVDVYFKRRDLSGSNFSPYPYAVGGVAFASKPLQQAFGGLGWGPAIANVYIGAMIVTSHPSVGHTSTDAKFGFGLNIGVKDVAAKLGWKSQIAE
jgi:hypothetical protein